MAHMSPSSEIIKAYSDLDAQEKEVVRTGKVHEKAISAWTETLERLKQLIKDGHMLEDRLLEAVYLHHDGNMEIREVYDKLARMYREARGRPFGILQFWQTGNGFGSEIIRLITAPHSHWVLYAGIAKGSLEFGEGHKPCFPVEKYGFAEGVHHFNFSHDFSIKDGPMTATETIPDSTSLHHPSGLYDWTKAVAGLKMQRRGDTEILSGFQEEKGHHLYTFIAFSKEGLEKLGLGYYYVPGTGFNIAVDRECSDNIRWCIQDALKECGYTKPASA